MRLIDELGASTALYTIMPLFAPDDGGKAGDDALADDQQANGDDGKDDANQSDEPGNDNADGSADGDADDPFSALDQANRDWLVKKGLDGDVAALAKTAFEADKLIGNSIKLPGKKASEDERSEFWNKLGRPAEAEKYEFDVPTDMPEDLPYDGEVADEFKTFAHSIGLTQAQAAAAHDWYVGKQVAGFNSAATAAGEQLTETVNTVNAGLEKRWGSMDGEQAKVNLELADRALMGVFGPEGLAELKKLKVVHEVNGEGDKKHDLILSEHLAVGFAKLGAMLFKEDGVERGGRNTTVDNPFSDDTFNLTNAMAIKKKDPDLALELIAAAGKKPEDFGIKTSAT